MCNIDPQGIVAHLAKDRQARFVHPARETALLCPAAQKYAAEKDTEPFEQWKIIGTCAYADAKGEQPTLYLPRERNVSRKQSLDTDIAAFHR